MFGAVNVIEGMSLHTFRCVRFIFVHSTRLWYVSAGKLGEKRFVITLNGKVSHVVNTYCCGSLENEPPLKLAVLQFLPHIEQVMENNTAPLADS